MKNLKKRYLIPLLAVLMIALAACGKDKPVADSAATSDTPSSVSLETIASTEIATEQTVATEETKAKKKNKKSNTQETTVQPTTRSDYENIPKDNITSKNINPNLNNIQSKVASEMNEIEVTKLSLSSTKVRLEVGKTAEIAIKILPENATDKRVAINLSNANISVETSGAILKIKGEKEGECKMTVTSRSGLTATCSVTVIAAETEPPETTQFESTTE